MNVDYLRGQRSSKAARQIVRRREADRHDCQQQNGDAKEELPVVLAPWQALRQVGRNFRDSGHVFPFEGTNSSLTVSRAGQINLERMSVGTGPSIIDCEVSPRYF